MEGEVLVEEGVGDSYLEHWVRIAPADRFVAVALREVDSGEPALLVRCGTHFGWARGRATSLPTGALRDLVAAAVTDDGARALLDVEVSVGRVTGSGWVIERSSLPDRSGNDLHLVLDGERASTDDGRQWVVERVEGERALLARTFTEIPVVDVSDLLHGTLAEQRVVAQELGRAAREVGFLYVTGTDVCAELFDDLLRVTKTFYELPLEQKMAVYIGLTRNHRGYVPVGEEVLGGQTRDLKEAYDVALELPHDDPDWLAGNPLLGPNLWPDLPGFAETVTAYYDAVLALGRAIMRGFAMAMGEAPDFFDEHVRKPPSQLRLLHYPRGADDEDLVGAGAHTDYECFTMLRSTSPGLEVLNGVGEWVDAPPRQDAFVLNIGDLLETWTNGTFVATTHRVRKVAEQRWSFPLFFNVDYDTVVSPLPQFLREGEQPAPALVAGEHLFAQTAQTFGYLKRRIEAGALTLPEGSRALSSFGQSARLGFTA
ncbi:MAG: isopenicillin N synthase family oxygenase [Frankiales bacterium]|nr:isopenicillin N synthase family oxygenase [Frankiales bacterium]